MKLFDGYQNVLTTGDVGVYQEIVLPATICWKKEHRSTGVKPS